MVNVMNKYQLANYIYEQRKQLGLSQKELAAMLGVTNKSTKGLLQFHVPLVRDRG